MKQKIVILVLSCLLVTACAQNNADNLKGVALDAGKPVLKNQTDSLSWAYGQNIAASLQKGYFATLDANLVLRSVAYTLAGGEQPLSDDEARQAVDYIMFMYSRDAQRQAVETSERVNAQQQAYFDTLVRANPDVKKHPAGFYYQQLRPGKGPLAKLNQRIRFDYRSYFMFSGEPYDQTYGKREPIIHVVGSPMFPGLIEAFQVMNAGSVYRFYFPYQLAFGEKGTGGIPPYAPMIYEIELHDAYND